MNSSRCKRHTAQLALVIGLSLALLLSLAALGQGSQAMSAQQPTGARPLPSKATLAGNLAPPDAPAINPNAVNPQVLPVAAQPVVADAAPEEMKPLQNVAPWTLPLPPGHGLQGTTPDAVIPTTARPPGGLADFGAADQMGRLSMPPMPGDADGVYTADFGSAGWDILPGDRFNIHMSDDHGHATQYSFLPPAPDVGIQKWNTPGYARPGGVYVYGIYYQNGGNGVAADTLIVDTLPTSTTWAGDTSGLSHIEAGGLITWNLGNVTPNDYGMFMVTLDVSGAVPTGTGVITSNCVAITTTTPGDYDLGNNDSCAGPVDVWEEDINVSVHNWANPSDPTPGQEFGYTLRWCAGQGAAAGPVWLTDTLPASTTFVSWRPQNWWEIYWTEVVTAGGQLVLYAPGLPGHMCADLSLRLLLDAGAQISTTLQNTVVITAPGDMAFDNESINSDAHVSGPRYDMNTDKWYNGGVLVPGGWIGYGANWWNAGNIATHAWITDTLPPGASYQPGSGRDHNGQPFEPTVIGNQLVWDLGVVPVNDGFGLDFALDISDTAVPNTVLTNCVTVGITASEDTPGDNTTCVAETINAAGPNLRVRKWGNWNGDGQLGYQIRFENIGDQTVSDVWITDTLPLSTTYGGWWDMDFDVDRLVTYTESSDVLRWSFSELYKGDSGWLRFNANLDEPGMPLRWYTNTVEIAPDDPYPADNIYTDVAFSGGEVRWVDLDVHRTRIWGCAYSDPVTVTTAHEQRVYGGDCWNDNFNDSFQPGGVVTIASGAATHPVVIQIPNPFTAYASSITETAWGQIDALDHEWVHVALYDGRGRNVQTDGSGAYSATFPDIPRGGRGEVRYSTEIDYADVAFHREFQPPDLIITVDYDDDWVQGNYEAGHTVWITVTESDRTTVKGTAVLTTGVVPGWGGQTGFSTNWQRWTRQPGIVPGDWVFGLVNSASYTTTVRVGTINGEVDVDADTVSGTLNAPWLGVPVLVRCEIHEENGPDGIQAYNVDPDGGGFYCDFSGAWDIVPGHNVVVNYTEPDGDRVQTHPPNPAPRISISKWANGNPGEGSNFAFQVQYWNNGGLDAADVVITDTLLGGMTYLADTSGFPHTGSGSGPVVWDLGALPANSSGQFYVFVEITAVASDTITNTAQIATSNPHDQGDPGEKESWWSGHVEADATHLNVDKDAWTHDPAPGYDFVYIVNPCNGGHDPTTSSAEVALTDTLPLSTTLVSWWADDAGWTQMISEPHRLVLSRPTINAHQCRRVYLHVHLADAVNPGDELCNTAAISASNDLAGDDNETTWCHNVGDPRTNLNVDKWLEAGRLVPGGEILYEFHYSNSGNLPVDNVLITDTLPMSTTFNRAWQWTPSGQTTVTPTTITTDHVVWNIGTLDNGYSGDIYVHLDVDNDPSPGTVLTNAVEIGPQPGEDSYDDNTSTVVERLHDYGPNLRVDKYHRWEGKNRVFYGILVKNLGTTRMEDIWITDTYPISATSDGNFWVGHGPWFTSTHDAPNRQFIVWTQELDAGRTGHIGFWVDLDESIHGAQGLVFTNTVEAAWPGDVDPADNTGVELAYTGPDLYTEKWISDGEPRPGARITFTLRCGNSNVSPWEVPDGVTTRLTERLPDGVSYVTSVWPDGNPNPPWFYDPDTGLMIWDMGRLGSDDDRWFYLVVDLDADLEGDDVLLNQVEFQAWPDPDIDPNPNSNAFVYPVAVLHPKFEVGKVYEGSRVAGMPVTYTLTVTNTGTEAGTNVVLSDTLPAPLNNVGTDGTLVSGDVTWSFTSIAPYGGTASSWFSGTLPCTTGSVTNDDYRVVSSDESVISLPGAPVVFGVVASAVDAAFDVSTDAVVVGTTIHFTGTGTTDGTPIVEWEWDFDDGSAHVFTQNASHTYLSDGTFTPRLTVTDTCGYAVVRQDLIEIVVAPHMIYLPLVIKGTP